jgi:hypothetical protein
MKSASPSSSAGGQDCGCCSSFGRPHLKECSRASGHTCISNGDQECKACELLQNCSRKPSDLHPSATTSTIVTHSVSASKQLAKDRLVLNAHSRSTITKHQNTMTASIRVAAGLVSNLEALLGYVLPEASGRRKVLPCCIADDFYSNSSVEFEASSLSVGATGASTVKDMAEGGQRTFSSPISIPGQQLEQTSTALHLVESTDSSQDSKRGEDDTELQVFCFDEELWVKEGRSGLKRR